MMFPEVLEQLTVAYNLGFQKAEKDDVEKFKEDLVNTLNSTYRKSKKDNLTVESIKDKEFFKVRFTEALDLVRTRKVFLYQGIVSKYRTHFIYTHAIMHGGLYRWRENSLPIFLFRKLKEILTRT